MRPGFPLPWTSISAVVVLLGLVAGVVLGAGTGAKPVQDVRPPDGEPGVSNIGGDDPPMEYTPAATSSLPKPQPKPTSPPPQSRPVVTPQTTAPQPSIVRTTEMPLPQLPTLNTQNPRSDIGA
ncbi:hypothetical protein Lesp02_50310 [Lentzea sp. NBRC 105346]|uniref:hypothetical protein n=1 Tax=Lentzea sp. NBRC 105346 TaxID=3032205 RepID=UPI0024A13691|nr:hypothetical protein [Lentzea sp. NBRC 105346]GLZ32843.1 hypothetical protein Lesp02_50310 [Lentzea sp. NBRC 105346]